MPSVKELIAVEYQKEIWKDFKVKNRDDYIDFIASVSQMMGYWDNEFVSI